MMDKSKEARLNHATNASYKNIRFTKKEVKQIIRDRKKGFTYKMLCEKYDTSKSTLSYFFNSCDYVKNIIDKK